MSKALVLLTVKPNPYHVEFFRKLGHDGYKLYIVVDDNTITLPQDTAITYIQVDENVCGLTGFCGGTHCTIPKQYTAWDKAIFYFSMHNTTHSYVWFIEDDVFVPTPFTIRNIDERYPTADLLSASNGKNTTGSLEWHWKQAVGKHPLPWACSMVCTIRVSQTLLQKVFDYVHSHKSLFFIEIMFNTLALHHGLEVITPPEMVNVVYSREWKTDELLAEHLYHPVKNVETMCAFHLKFNCDRS